MAYVIRNVGDDHEPRKFSTWAPKAVAVIGTLKDTLIDRSILIPMRRKMEGESVSRLKELDGVIIKRKCIRWFNDNSEVIRIADPKIPDTLHDRAADNWMPLFAIAYAAGGNWPEITRQAAIGLTQAEEDEDSIKTQLLLDIKTTFEEQGTDRIWTDQLLESLHGMEERAWSDWKNGRALSSRNLSQLLKRFGIRSKDIKIGGTNKKGYRLDDFNEAFSRYLPKQSATTLLASNNAPFSDFQCATPNEQVADEYALKPAQYKEGSGVAV